MVVHTVQAGLIELYLAIPGAPWKWPKWQSATGIVHGIFPKDPDDVPAPLTSSDIPAIQSYFSAYGAISSIEDRHAFASRKKKDAHDSGRVAWRAFVSKNWPRWKIQLKIHHSFFENDITFLQVMVDNGMDTLPPSIMVVLALDDIAFALFGADGMNESGRHLKQALIKPLTIWANQAASNLRRTSKNLMSRVIERGAEIEHILDVIDADEEPDERKLRELIPLVGAWKKDILVWNSPSNLEKLAEVEGSLIEVAKGLGVDLEETLIRRTTTIKKTKLKAEKFAELARKDEVTQVIAALEAHFSSDADIPELCGPSTIEFGVQEDGLDPGVAAESEMSMADLCSNLGLDEGGMLSMFNTTKHSGTTAWTKDGEKIFSDYTRKGDSSEHACDMEPSKLHYHQVAGMHSWIRQALEQKPNPQNPMGALGADTVGLGKSRMAAAAAAWLIENGLKQDLKKRVPPLLEAKPVFGTVHKIPDAPTLILTPGTLVDQWFNELHTLFKPKSVDIMAYPTSNRADRRAFWSENGVYSSSRHRPRNRIIVANHSTLSTEFRLLYKVDKESQATTKKFPWDIPTKLASYEATAGTTLLGTKFLVVIIDEAHFYRNPGNSHSAALALTQGAWSRFMLTATPLQTRTEDIGAMGRLCNIAHFFTQKYFDETSDDASEIRRAKNDDESLIPAIQVTASRRMQAQFSGRLICRRATSQDFDGNSLLDLPELTITHFPLQLQDWELEFVDSNLSDESLDRIAMASLMGVQTQSFYANERLTATLPRENPSAPVPRVTSMRKWDRMNRPTKLDAIARLAAYLLFSGCRTVPSVVNGRLVIPEYQPIAGGDNKLLIYQEFTVFMQLLIDVLRVHGVEAVFINGTQAFKTRNSIIKKFKENPKTRCFVFSKVGAVGLNLTEANYMIFLDQQWSFADENQAIGRLHRQGQKRPVGVFHILAAGTVDYVLYNAARGKALMSQAFLTTEKQEKMANLVSGGDPGLGEVQSDEDEDKETPRVQPSGSDSSDAGPKPKRPAASVSKSSKSKGKTKSTSKGRKDEGSGDDDGGPDSSDADPKQRPAASATKSSKSKGKTKSTSKRRKGEGSGDDDRGPDSSDADPKPKRSAASATKSSKSKGKTKSTSKGRKGEGSGDDDGGPDSSDADPKPKRSAASATKSSKSKGKTTSTSKGRDDVGSEDDDRGADSESEARSRPPAVKAKKSKAGKKAVGEDARGRERSPSLTRAKKEERSRSRKEKPGVRKEKLVSKKEKLKPSTEKFKKRKAEAEEEEEDDDDDDEGEGGDDDVGNRPEEARERQRTTVAKSGKGVGGKATSRNTDFEDRSDDRPAQKTSTVKGKDDVTQAKGNVEHPGRTSKSKESKSSLKETKGKGVLRVEGVEIVARKKAAPSAEGGGEVKGDGGGKANEASGVVKSGKKSALKNVAAAKQSQASGSSKSSLKEKVKRKPPPKSSEIVGETDSGLNEYPGDELSDSEPKVPSTKAPTTAPGSDRDDTRFNLGDMEIDLEGMGIDFDVEMGRYSRPGSSASMNSFSDVAATSSLKGSIALQQKKKRERAESIQHAGVSSGKRQREYTSPQQTVVRAPHAGVPPLPLHFTQPTQPTSHASFTPGALDPPFAFGATGRHFAQKPGAGSGEGSRASSQSGSRSRPHSTRPRSPSSQGSRFGLVKGGRQPLGHRTFTPEEDVEMGDNAPLEIDHAQAPFTQYPAGEDPRGRRTNTDIRAKIDAGLLERRMGSLKKYEPQHVVGEPSASSSSRSQMGHVFRRGAAAFAPPPGSNAVPTMTQPFSSAAIAVKKDKGKKKEKKKGKNNEREKESE